MPMSELLETLENGVLTLTFNRPARQNTMTPSMSRALSSAVARAAGDEAVRCLVLTGADRVFCGGGDFEELPSEDNSMASSDERRQFLRDEMNVVRVLHEMPKPTLAIVNGAAAGVGFALALACDLRFCLDTAKLTTAFARIGTSGDSGVSYFLPRLIGAAKAYELMFMSSVITGQQAFELGLATQVVSADEFDQAAQAYAKRLAELPTVAIGYMKQNLVASFNSTLSETLDLEADHMIRTLDTEDHRQAVTAFLNKTRPTFAGR